jgi:AcrR family transcriptional regulator
MVSFGRRISQMARYTRTDWLEQGLDLLVRQGIEAVTIDAMCQLMKVTKGSFYHHFASQPVFLEALLQHWEEHYTTRFITESLAGATPMQQLRRLSVQVIEAHGSAEAVIRAWALTSPLARTYQERVDARRLAHLRDLWAQILKDETQAATVANLMYSIVIGSQSMLPPVTSEELTQIFRLLEHFFSAISKESSP